MYLLLLIYVISITHSLPLYNVSSYGTNNYYNNNQKSNNNPLIGYDCSNLKGSEMYIYSIQSVTECQDPTISIRKNDNRIGQVIQRRLYEKIQYNACWISEEINIKYCGALWKQYSVKGGWSQKVIKPSKDVCSKIVDTGIFDTGFGIIDNIPSSGMIHRTMSIVGSYDYNGYCLDDGSYSDGSETYNNVVVTKLYTIITREGQGTIKREDNKILFPELNLECEDYTEDTCFDDLIGRIIWKSTNVRDICSNNALDVLYEGRITITNFTDTYGDVSSVIQLRDHNHMFALRLIKRSRYCNMAIYYTEHSRIMVIINEIGDKLFTIKNNKHIIAENIDLTYYINSKFLYVTTNIHLSQENMYKAMRREACLNRKMIFENRIALARENPQYIGQLMGKKKGVHGRVMGEVIYVVTCQAVVVSPRKTTRCFQEIPITTQSKARFLSPVSRIIVNIGTEIDCIPAMPPLYLHGDKWFSRGPETSLSLPPTILDPNIENTNWEGKPMMDIGSLGLYTQEALDKFQKAILFPSSREAITNEISFRTLTDSTFSLAKIFNENDVTKLKKSMIDTIGPLGMWLGIGGGWLGIFFLSLFIVKLIISTLANCFIIKNDENRKAFGCVGLILAYLFSCLDSVTRAILRFFSLSVHKNSTGKTMSGANLQVQSNEETTRLTGNDNEMRSIISAPDYIYPDIRELADKDKMEMYSITPSKKSLKDGGHSY